MCCCWKEFCVVIFLIVAGRKCILRKEVCCSTFLIIMKAADFLGDLYQVEKLPLIHNVLSFSSWMNIRFLKCFLMPTEIITFSTLVLFTLWIALIYFWNGNSTLDSDVPPLTSLSNCKCNEHVQQFPAWEEYDLFKGTDLSGIKV